MEYILSSTMQTDNRDIAASTTTAAMTTVNIDFGNNATSAAYTNSNNSGFHQWCNSDIDQILVSTMHSCNSEFIFLCLWKHDLGLNF